MFLAFRFIFNPHKYIYIDLEAVLVFVETVFYAEFWSVIVVDTTFKYIFSVATLLGLSLNNTLVGLSACEVAV